MSAERDADERMKLSVLIPAHNEVGSLQQTVESVDEVLSEAAIEHEIVVVDDASWDGTAELLKRLAAENPRLRSIRNPKPRGYGFAIRAGLEVYKGDAVAIVMADGSDDPLDLVLYYRVLEAGYDCAFGSRFMPGAEVTGYPLPKRILNRIANAVIRVLFRHGYNDTTNAFKAYRREVADAVQPLLSNHFNLTVEMPLKAIVRGFSYAIVPTSWTNRSAGESKLALNEMGSRYVFIVLYVFLEHHLSRGDYRRADYDKGQKRTPPRHQRAVDGSGNGAADFDSTGEGAPRGS
jgi:dolichol-phosphate mannosyltransferase